MSSSQEARKNLKGIPCYPSKICKSLPEHLILQSILPGCLSLFSSRLYSRTRQYPIKEHLILSECPDFVLSRTPQIPWQKHTSEHLFYKTAPSSCFHKCQLFFLKGTLMQIWNSENIFVLMWKQYVEDFTLKHLLLFEICAREMYEKFVYKHSETKEYVKN